MIHHFHTNRSTQLTLHGIGVLGVIAILCFLLFLRQKVQAKLIDTQAAQTAAISLLKSSESIRKQHQDGIQRVKLAQTHVAQLKNTIPAAAGEIDFLSELTELATATRFGIRDYRPGAIVVQPLHKEMEVRFIGEGSYSALCRFLDGLPRLQRSYRIGQLNVSSPRNGSQDFSVEIQLRLLFDLNQDLVGAEKKR